MIDPAHFRQGFIHIIINIFWNERRISICNSCFQQEKADKAEKYKECMDF